MKSQYQINLGIFFENREVRRNLCIGTWAEELVSEFRLTLYLNAWTRYELIILMNLVSKGSLNSSKKIALT